MPFKAAIMAILISPMIVPLIITAAGVFFFYAKWGLVGTYTGLILAHTALGTPFVVITVTATLSGFDHSVTRAAASLGSNPVNTFMKITLPLILPGVISGGLFNFGASTPSGVHAPSATPDGLGGVVAIFNMNPGMETKGWNQIMTLPRLLTLGNDSVLKIEPAGDIESLRYDHKHLGDTVLPPNEEIVLDGIKGNTIEIIAEIDAKTSPMVELNVLRSKNREEYTRITFFKNRGFRITEWGDKTGALLQSGNTVVSPYGTPRSIPYRQSVLSIDSSYSSALPGALSRPPETTAVDIGVDEPLKLRIFIDRSVVEVE